MNVSDMHPSKFLAAADLKGSGHKVIISRLEQAEVGQEKEQKWVLYFQGKEKGLVLNKTNSLMIASSLGDETDNWMNKEIVIYPTKTSFAGKPVDAIRVRVGNFNHAFSNFLRRALSLSHILLRTSNNFKFCSPNVIIFD